MFNRIKDFFSSTSKGIKILVIIILIAVVITAKIIDVNKADDKTPSSSANTSDSTEEQTGIHIGIGHIVMLIVFSAAYGIDRVIVYRNNLKDEQKYDNYKEK